MLGQSILKAISLVAFFSCTAPALGCEGRDPGQFLRDTSFEDAGSFEWDFQNGVLGSTPAYPAHSGSKSVALTASYSKTAAGEVVNNYAWLQQFVYNSRTASIYRIKAHYSVISHTKGSSCPDTSLPRTDCKLKITYVDQTLGTIGLHPTNGYVEFNTKFTPQSSGRYINFNVECKPAATTPGCGEITILFDDITWNDPGHLCWVPLGCHTDSVSNRALPHHGRLPNYPQTTTIQACQEACGSQGYSLAGLEFGHECFCGNALIGSTPVPAAQCNMPCRGDSRQLCGSADRIDVYTKG